MERRRPAPSLPAFPQAVEDYQLLSSPAVADVSDAPGKEVIVGTGPLPTCATSTRPGVEGTGWPKFTGGWIFATPAIGDVDGDGKLEVADADARGQRVRVGHRRSPPAARNDEWWTSRHDEWNDRRARHRHAAALRVPGGDRARPRRGDHARPLDCVPGDD